VSKTLNILAAKFGADGRSIRTAAVRESDFTPGRRRGRPA
jgi:hypothetical protein